MSERQSRFEMLKDTINLKLLNLHIISLKNYLLEQIKKIYFFAQRPLI